MADGGKTAVNSEEMMADDDAERSVASVEDQLRKEMTVYEVCSLFSLFFKFTAFKIWLGILSLSKIL